MSKKTRIVTIAAAASLAFVGCGEADTAVRDDEVVAEADARVAELEARAAEADARVAELEAQIDELVERSATTDTSTTDGEPTTGPPDSDAPVVTEAPSPEPPEVTAPAPPPSVDPYLIPAGVIEDGIHVGYLVSAASNSFSFDRADIQSDGTWRNVNPKIRTLPVSPSVNYQYGAPPGVPIELGVRNQHVEYVIAIGS